MFLHLELWPNELYKRIFLQKFSPRLWMKSYLFNDSAFEKRYIGHLILSLSVLTLTVASWRFGSCIWFLIWIILFFVKEPDQWTIKELLPRWYAILSRICLSYIYIVMILPPADVGIIQNGIILFFTRNRKYKLQTNKHHHFFLSVSS